MRDVGEFSPKIYRRVLFPGALFAFTVFSLTVLWLTLRSEKADFLFFMSLTGSLYGLVVGLFMSRYGETIRNRWGDWVHVFIAGISLGWLTTLAPKELFFIPYFLFVLNLLVFSLLFSIERVRLLILIVSLVYFYGVFVEASLASFLDWVFLLSFPFLSFVIAEIVHRFKKTVVISLKRVTIINAISRKLSSSLDEEEVHTWLKEAIQDSFAADTYYLALLDGDYLDLGLFYDDGEYFHAVKIPLAGTLGGWAIRNGQTLFLNDLRTEPNLEGVRTRLVGKEKSSLSWLGVPFQTEYVTGLTGIASYKPLAFSQYDVELLESLTQQAALALNNARQHKLMTMQARMDSLTQIYNHGYFLLRLHEELTAAKAGEYPLAVIMLDVDYFKKYNDTYGHLVGDEVLMLMVETIQRFIKEHDVIGRWGGEEFAICLPNTSLQEAQAVAVRIQKTLENMTISVFAEKNIPVPTVSQGIAEFPREADEAFALVDLADKRLYVAKERGRNQIESN